MHTKLNPLTKIVFASTLVLLGTTGCVERHQSSHNEPTDVARGTIQGERSNAAAYAMDDASSKKVSIAEGRLNATRALFKSEGITGALRILNNKLDGSTERNRIQESNTRDLNTPMNGVSGVNCIMDSVWKADGTGAKSEKTAKDWVDANGHSMLDRVVQALRESKDGVARVPYMVSVGNPLGGTPTQEKRIVIAASSGFLGWHKSGNKFFCFVEVS